MNNKLKITKKNRIPEADPHQNESDPKHWP